MESHFLRTLNRRQLQTLCKKNKIPANLTNVAMADALSALQFVQGMEELSIESPAPTSRTYTTTTAATPRTTSFQHQSNEPSTLRTTRRSSTRGLRQSQPHPTPPPCLNTTLDFNQIQGQDQHHVGQEKENLSHLTPCVLPVSHQRAALTRETTMSQVQQGTRRSTRLAARNELRGSNTIHQISQTALKNMDFGEITNTNFNGQSCADVDSVAESTANILHLNETSEESVDYIALVLSDCSAEDKNKFETGFNEDGAKGNICNDGKSFENGEELDINDVASDDVQEIPINHYDAFSVDSGIDLNMPKEEVECKQECKQDFGLSNDVVFFQTKDKNVPEDGISVGDENEVEPCNCAAENQNEKGNSFENGEELDINDVAPDDVQEIPINHSDDAFSVDGGIDLNTPKEEVECKQDFELSHGVVFFQTKDKNVLEDGIAVGDENEVEPCNCAAENQNEKGKDLEDLDLSRIHNVVLQSNESADTEIEPKTEEQHAGIIKHATEPKVENSCSFVEETLEINFPGTSNASESLNALYSEYGLTQVEATDSGVKASMEMEIKEEESVKDLITGHPEMPVMNGVMFEQLDGDGGVLEIQADPNEEEDLKNNSYVECSTKKQATDPGVKASMEMEIKEEELVKDLITGHPEMSVMNGVMFEQLDGDGGVLEIQAGPNEEEDLKNNSYVECSTKKQDMSAVDEIVTTTVTLCTRDKSVLAVDCNENLSDVGMGEEVTGVIQLLVPTQNCWSPIKIPLQKTVSSKTPTSGKRIAMLVSDDKENIENFGSAKMKNEKKGIGMENSQKQCWDERTSLRKLKKELKAKLEEKANKNIKQQGGRPALQALGDNPLVGNS